MSDDIFTSLGEAISLWWEVERQLATIYGAIHIPENVDIGFVESMQARSIDLKCKMVSREMTRLSWDKSSKLRHSEIATWQEIEKCVRESAKKRNFLAHSTFLQLDGQQCLVKLLPRKDQSFFQNGNLTYTPDNHDNVTKQQVDDMIGEFASLVGKLARFLGHLHDAGYKRQKNND